MADRMRFQLDEHVDPDQDTKGEIAAINKGKYAQVELYEAKLNETSFDLDIVGYASLCQSTIHTHSSLLGS